MQTTRSGKAVGNTYRVERELGQRGIAVVHLARERQLTITDANGQA
jgi:hypothetical protein